MTQRSDWSKSMSASDLARFWNGNLEGCLPPRPAAPADQPPALQLLGPLPFPRGGFPLMGFFASVYDHVSKTASGE
jgi:hypothetical protein